MSLISYYHPEDARPRIAESFGQSSRQASKQASSHTPTPIRPPVRRRRQPQVSLTWITVLSYLFISSCIYLCYLCYFHSQTSASFSPVLSLACSLTVDTASLVSDTRLSPISCSYLNNRCGCFPPISLLFKFIKLISSYQPT